MIENATTIAASFPLDEYKPDQKRKKVACIHEENLYVGTTKSSLMRNAGSRVSSCFCTLVTVSFAGVFFVSSICSWLNNSSMLISLQLLS